MLDDDERRMLRELAAVAGLDASNFLRHEIRRIYAERLRFLNGTRVPGGGAP